VPLRKILPGGGAWPNKSTEQTPCLGAILFVSEGVRQLVSDVLAPNLGYTMKYEDVLI
jgi:hypothetical protein